MTYRILTVCTGNICRSPMAEVVLQDRADRMGADIVVGSAAVTSYEVGNPIDPRARTVLRRAGYSVPNHAARRITAEDIVDQDLILAMTAQHAADIRRVAKSVPEQERAEIRLWTDFCAEGGPAPGADVPDPWYGDIQDFVETLDTLESAADNIVAYARGAEVEEGGGPE